MSPILIHSSFLPSLIPSSFISPPPHRLLTSLHPLFHLPCPYPFNLSSFPHPFIFSILPPSSLLTSLHPLFHPSLTLTYTLSSSLPSLIPSYSVWCIPLAYLVLMSGGQDSTPPREDALVTSTRPSSPQPLPSMSGPFSSKSNTSISMKTFKSHTVVPCGPYSWHCCLFYKKYISQQLP